MKINYFLNVLLGVALSVALVNTFQLMQRQSANHTSSVLQSLEGLQTLDERIIELAQDPAQNTQVELDSLSEQVYLLDEEYSRLRFELIFEAVNSAPPLSQATDDLKLMVDAKLAVADELDEESIGSVMSLKPLSEVSLEDALSGIEELYETYRDDLTAKFDRSLWLVAGTASLFILSLLWSAIASLRNIKHVQQQRQSVEQQLQLKNEELKIAEDLFSQQKHSQDDTAPALLDLDKTKLAQQLQSMAQQLEAHNATKQAVSELLGQLHDAVSAKERNKEQISKILKKLVKFYIDADFPAVVLGDREMVNQIKSML